MLKPIVIAFRFQIYKYIKYVRDITFPLHLLTACFHFRGLITMDGYLKSEK